MKSTTYHEQQDSKNRDINVPIFGYELIRDILIPDILGKDTPDILYWAGKSLARKFPLVTTEEMIAFFMEAGWGRLELIVMNKKEMKFELSGPIIARRIDMKSEDSFKLEAGFLAEQIQNQKKVITETIEEVHNKQKKVTFLLRWDQKDTV